MGAAQLADLPPAGVYVFWLYLPIQVEAQVGALGLCRFPAGYYAYAGSAQRNLPARLRRHSLVTKPRHWHLDYLRPYGTMLGAAAAAAGKPAECGISRALAATPGAGVPAPGFGASDCRCTAHLYWFARRPPVIDQPALLYSSLANVPMALMNEQMAE